MGVRPCDNGRAPVFCPRAWIQSLEKLQFTRGKMEKCKGIRHYSVKKLDISKNHPLFSCKSIKAQSNFAKTFIINHLIPNDDEKEIIIYTNNVGGCFFCGHESPR